MIPVRTDRTNVLFAMDGCADLPGTVFYNPSADCVEVETCWDLTDEEVERITTDRRIYLYTKGRTIPPMLIVSKSLLSGQPARWCDTCEHNGWDMPQCRECNAQNGYKWYVEATQ